MSKCCSVACDTEDGVLACTLTLPDAATLAEALALARERLGAAAADWPGAAVGVYGQIHPRTYVPADGDRIELYRPLPADPRAARRARVRRRAAAARNGHRSDP